MLRYEDIKVEERKQKGKEIIRFIIYKYFYKDVAREKIIEELGEFRIQHGRIQIKGYAEARNQRRVLHFFRRYKQGLTMLISSNPAIYVDEDLGLPLLGTNFLGILDKGSEILEIKPVTNCNASCSFCSVNEGYDSLKERDFVVDLDYLLSGITALLDFKQETDMSLWVNPHGEPTLYGRLTAFCDIMLPNKYVKDIHIITNGLLLDNDLIDALAEIVGAHGKDIHVSLSLSGLRNAPEKRSALNPKGLPIAKLMMGRHYTVDRVLHNLNYAVKKLPVTLTPVWVHGMNDKEMKKLAALAKELSQIETRKVGILIQKFCRNKQGRNPVKEQSWQDFFRELGNLEKETGITLTRDIGKLKATKTLPKLCQKGDRIQVKILCPSRYQKHKLGVYQTPLGRSAVAVLDCAREKGMVKAKVLQNKYNVLVAKAC